MYHLKGIEKEFADNRFDEKPPSLMGLMRTLILLNQTLSPLSRPMAKKFIPSPRTLRC